MGSKTICKTTTNRGEFNRAYKLHLEQNGKIRCSYCGYHHGENSEKKWYGGYVYDDMEICRGKRKGANTRFPNWKLVSKNKKQWMIKPIKKKKRYFMGYSRICIDITW